MCNEYSHFFSLFVVDPDRKLRPRRRSFVRSQMLKRRSLKLRKMKHVRHDSEERFCVFGRSVWDISVVIFVFMISLAFGVAKSPGNMLQGYNYCTTQGAKTILVAERESKCIISKKITNTSLLLFFGLKNCRRPGFPSFWAEVVDRQSDKKHRIHQ